MWLEISDCGVGRRDDNRIWVEGPAEAVMLQYERWLCPVAPPWMRQQSLPAHINTPVRTAHGMNMMDRTADFAGVESPIWAASAEHFWAGELIGGDAAAAQRWVAWHRSVNAAAGVSAAQFAVILARISSGHRDYCRPESAPPDEARDELLTVRRGLYPHETMETSIEAILGIYNVLVLGLPDVSSNTAVMWASHHGPKAQRWNPRMGSGPTWLPWIDANLI